MLLGTARADVVAKRVGVAFSVAILLAAPARAAEPVDLALVLAADVSRSINDREFELERQGYAAAIASSQVLAAIHSGQHGAIALCFLEWAGADEQRLVVDWSTIRTKPDAERFVASLLAAPRSFTGRTAIGSALIAATALLSDKGFDAPRHVIDVSGDGTNNQGAVLADARAAALAAAITINGLSIYNKEAAKIGGFLEAHTNPPGGLEKYYRENVIGGPGAFVLPIDDFRSFGESMIRKLVTEISSARAGRGPG